MSRRRAKAPAPIVIEDRASRPPCVRLMDAVESLQLADRPRYLQLVELAESYAAAAMNARAGDVN